MSFDTIALWTGYATITSAVIFGGCTVASLWWFWVGGLLLYVLQRILKYTTPVKFPSYEWASGRFYKIGPTFSNGSQSRNIGFWITYSCEIADKKDTTHEP